jgi:hypothetical protein
MLTSVKAEPGCCCATCTLAPLTNWMALMVTPRLPMMTAMRICGHVIFCFVCPPSAALHRPLSPTRTPQCIRHATNRTWQLLTLH